VGVVGHVKTTNFNTPVGTSHAFSPTAQNNNASSRTLLVRSLGDPLDAASAVVPVIRGLDPAITTTPASLVSTVYDSVLATPRFYLVLMSLLAALALLTACVGLFGVVSYSVSQRTREIGVRIALGAGSTRIRRLVLREALLPVLVGIMAGLVGAWWLTSYLTTLLYRVTPHDPVTTGIVVAGLILVAILAAWVPARRAMRVDPVQALRGE
jgi:ABC-type antimicrobial peptide transport system permease subunit